MELGVFSIIGLSLIAYLVVSFVYKNIKYSNKDPKGPIELPILGSLHLLGENPHHGFKKLSDKYGDVFKMYLGDTYTIIVSDPKMLHGIYVKNHENFINRHHSPTYKIYSSNYTNLVSGDAERWRYNRDLFSPSFTNLKVKSIQHIVDNQCVEFIKALKNIKSNELFSPRLYLQKYSMNIITKLVFGQETPYDKTSEQFKELIKYVEILFVECGTGNISDHISFLSPFYLAKMKIGGNVMTEFRSLLKVIYDDHLKNLDIDNPKDLLDEILIKTKDQDNHFGIISVLIDLFLAGTDTSANTLEWLMLQLLNNPTIQDKVHKELVDVVGKGNVANISHRALTPYTLAVIKETLRFTPIAPLALSRNAKEDITINGYFIPKNTQIMQNVYALHHNESRYPNHDVFMPERFLNDNASDAHIWGPFGIGPRDCVGKHLAQSELYIATANILLNFKLVLPPGVSRLSLHENFGLTVSPDKFSFYLEPR